MKNKLLVTLNGALLAFGLLGCSLDDSFINTTSSSDTQTSNTATSTSTTTTSTSTTTTGTTTSGSTTTVLTPEQSYQEIEASFEISTDVSDGYYINNNAYVITKGGDYTLSGELSDGYIYVDTNDEKVTLILNNVKITSTLESPIFAINNDKLTIKSLENTYNEINDNRSGNAGDGNAAIYAKCDLAFSGKGSLLINGNYNSGIHSTKDVAIKNTTIKVVAYNNALKGNDSVSIESGNITLISTGGNGIITENSDISSKGNQRGTIEISGGNIDIYCAKDAIDASYDANISGDANINIYTDSYSSYTGQIFTSSESLMYIKVTSSNYSSAYRYAIYLYNDEEAEGVFVDATLFETVSSSGYSRNVTYYLKAELLNGYKNIKFYKFNSSDENSTTKYVAKSSGQTINDTKDMFIINQSSSSISGSWSIYSNSSSYSAKGIKADNNINISGANITIKSTDDGIHANRDVELENGTSSEGSINITGGNITITSDDDAIHADYVLTFDDGYINVLTSYEGLEANQIYFNGGTAYVYAKDDGVNASGNYLNALIKVTGGYLDVSVPSGDVDGIDSNGSYIQTGGFVISKDATSDSNGNASALDCDGSVTISGGTFISVGSIGSTPTSSSQALRVTFGTSSQNGRGGMFGGNSSGVTFTPGTYVVEGTNITFTLSTTYKNMWICSDELTLNSTYNLTNGTTSKSWTQSSFSVNAN